MSRILVLGTTGMLGSMCLDHLSKNTSLEVIGTSRTGINGTLIFDPTTTNAEEFISSLKPEWIINCIGIVKTRITSENAESTSEAIRINALFPFELARACKRFDIRLIQIATDCVFSGKIGNYLETSEHDANDVYGKTKSLGEVNSDIVMNLRSSIIGPEISNKYSLLEWFRNQPNGAKIDGYENHYWNGVTTLSFAKVCEAIIVQNIFRSGVSHLVPENQVSKFELLGLLKVKFSREDLVIRPITTPVYTDRTLATHNHLMNKELWKLAGYPEVPSINQLVEEL
jgi:dTDP-4-dehydrorhamnose reductase